MYSFHIIEFIPYICVCVCVCVYGICVWNTHTYIYGMNFIISMKGGEDERVYSKPDTGQGSALCQSLF